jgi:hypothetical protein
MSLSAARLAAAASWSATRSRTTRAGAPTATEYGGRSRLTTAFAATTHPRPIVVPRSTVALVPSHTSGPIRTGDLTMPWSLIGTVTSSKTWSKSVTYTQSATMVASPNSTSRKQLTVLSLPKTTLSPMRSVPSWQRIALPAPTCTQRPRISRP